MTDHPTLESRARKITLFEDRAHVRRVARAELTTGQHTLMVSGLTHLIADSSLIATSRGAEVIAASIRRKIYERDKDPSRLEALSRREDEAEASLSRLDNRLEQISAQIQRLDRAEIDAIDAFSSMRSPVNNLEEMKAVVSTLDGEFQALLTRFFDTKKERNDARKELEHTRELIRQEKKGEPELKAFAIVTVEVQDPSPVEIELEYFTPCALWRPCHLVRLDPETKLLQWRFDATVWQLTGEDWTEVECEFSTSRIKADIRPPQPQQDLLTAQPKVDNQIHAEVRDMAIQSAQTTSSKPSEMPGVDDGGEPLTLHAAAAATIPSHGLPVRMEIGTHELNASTATVALPETMRAARLLARGTWTGPWPILAGPVDVVRGNTHRGKSLTNFVAQNDNFEVSLGVDNAIYITRDPISIQDRQMITGKTIFTRKVRLALSNLSNTPKVVEVIERIPVSELKEVIIQPLDGEPDKDGMVSKTITIAGRETRSLEVSYKVDASSKVQFDWQSLP